MGLLFRLDLKTFTTDAEVTYYAGKLGIAPYTTYMALTQAEVMEIVTALYKANQQAELLLQAEGQLNRAQVAVEKLATERDKAITEGKSKRRTSVVLNWIFIPATIGLTAGLIYITTHSH